MNKYLRKMLVLFFVPLIGCTTMRESVLLGVGSGAAAGAGISSAIEKGDSQAALTGAAIGAVVGGIASYFVHNGLENRDSKVRRETLFNLDKFSVSRPQGSEGPDYMVTEPTVETQCFDSEVRGDKLIQAHCESVIVNRPEWFKRKKKNNEH